MWDDLSSELLVTIFSRVGVGDLISGVPYVCSAWRQAVRDPSCSRVLDFASWYHICRRLYHHDINFAELLNVAITRSEGVIYSIFFPEICNEYDLEYAANRCPMLQYFSTLNPNIYEPKFCEVIGKLKCLKGIAVNERFICHHVLQHINQCCDNFFELKVFSFTMDRSVTSAICKCLPRLRKLEFPYTSVSRNDILTLLDGLKELEFLHVSKLPITGITNEVIEKVSHLKAIHWNPIYDSSELKRCSNCREYYSDQAPCECMLKKLPV